MNLIENASLIYSFRYYHCPNFIPSICFVFFHPLKKKQNKDDDAIDTHSCPFWVLMPAVNVDKLTFLVFVIIAVFC